MFDHVVIEQVVVEVALSHPPDQVIQLLLRIVCKPGRRKCPIVPVASRDESLKPEGLPRNRGVHGATAFGIGLEGLSASPPFYLIPLTPAREVVLVGIDGEQHP